MKKAFYLLLCCMLAVFLGACESSSDDDEVYGEGLTGKWDLVELQNGPEGSCRGDYVRRFPSGSVTIELKENGKIIFNYSDGKSETLDYSIPENQEQYGSIYPVMKIDEVPFGYAIEGNRLKLHYHGMYLCDHIPATFVFKRIR